MENRKSRLIISFMIVLAVSCNEPETVVTNIVQPDGSVIRKIEMKSRVNEFDVSEIQVPIDSTWSVRDSIEITGEGDTVWVKRAEKSFSNVGEINLSYNSDSGANKEVTRYAEFSKRFRWFNTEYGFSENIDRTLLYGHPAGDYLNQEELEWFYLPDKLKEERTCSADSIKFRALNDTLEVKLEKWYIRNLVSEWIGEFDKLITQRTGEGLSLESLKQKEGEFAMVVERNLGDFDSLWSNGAILREFIGEDYAIKFREEADSAVNMVSDRFFVTFKDYTIRTKMPGKLTDTNGFVDSSGVALWPVKSDYFLTEPYIMFAESRISNNWAWIVSGLFLIFVSGGIILRKKRKG